MTKLDVAMRAIDQLEVDQDKKRREKSNDLFGHSGAHMPEFFVSREDRVRVSLVAVGVDPEEEA